MNRAAGFTLIESLIVLSLLGIVVALAAPNFGGQVRANRVGAAADELQSVLSYARSEAITRGVKVTVTAPSVTGWTQNLTVATVASTLLGAAETLRAFDSAGLASRGVNSTGSTTSLTFRANGTLETAATIVLCATSDRGTTGRTLSLSQGGQVSSADFIPSAAQASGCS